MNIALAIDFETTGFKPTTAQGIQVGAIIIDLDTAEVLDEFKETVQFDHSNYKWSSGAEGVHGLSKAFLATQTPFLDGTYRFVDFVKKYFPDAKGIVVMAHNANFDIGFMHQWFQQAGEECVISKVIDTMPIAQSFYGQRKLDAVFEAMGIQRGDHDALDDVKMCALLWKKEVDSKSGSIA